MRFVRISAGGQRTFICILYPSPTIVSSESPSEDRVELLKSEVRAVGQRMDRIYQCSIEIKDQTLYISYLPPSTQK